MLAEVNTVNNTGRMTTTARGIAQRRGLSAGAVRWRDWGQLINVRRAWTALLCSPYRGQCQHVNPGYTHDHPGGRGTRPAAAATARYYSHRHRRVRAGRQTPGVLQCRHATSLSHARRHACTVIPPLTTTTTPPHDGRSTTSSTHQPLLALSRHTHTHTHTCQPQHSVHAAIPYTQHSTSNDDIHGHAVNDNHIAHYCHCSHAL